MADELEKEEGTLNQSKNAPYSFSPKGNFEKSLYKNVEGNTPDVTEGAKKTGQQTAEEIQKVVPRNSVKTWKDIWNDPQFKGKRGAYLTDTIGGVLSSLGTGQKSQTAMNQMNKVLEDQYATDVADVNTRAKNAQIEPLEAANKQKTDLELRLADTVANSYLERYKAAQDAETKKQILEQMIKDSSVWSELDFKDKLDTIMYLRTTAGQGSVLDMMLQEYLPTILGEKKNSGVGNGGGSGTAVDADGDGVPDIDYEDELTKWKMKTVLGNIGAEGNEMPLTVQGLIDADPAELLETIGASGRDVDEVLNELEDALWNTNLNDYKLADYQIAGDRTDAAKIIKKTRKLNNEFNDDIKKALKGKSNEKIYENLLDLGEPENTGLVAKYNDLVAEYGAKAIEDQVNNIKDMDITAKEKTTMIKQLRRNPNYQSIISTNPELRDWLSDEDIKLTYQAQYGEPLNNEIMTRFSSNYGNKKYNYRVKSNGNIEIKKGKSYVGEINPNSALGISNRTNVKDFLIFMAENASPTNVQLMMGSLSPEELNTVFTNSSFYKTLEGVVNNRDFQEEYKNNPNSETSRLYESVVTQYQSWNKE
jgi:hypothetical protein